MSMAVRHLAREVAVPNESLRTLAMRTGTLPKSDPQTEELVVIEEKEVGKIESHAGILPGVANQIPHDGRLFLDNCKEAFRVPARKIRERDFFTGSGEI